MQKIDIGEPIIDELRRLKDRFEDLSRHYPPASLCLVKVCKQIEDHQRHESGLYCVPPPEPWLSLVAAGAWQSHDDSFPIWDAYVIRTLIHRADEVTWRRLSSIAAYASRVLQFVPPAAWPGGNKVSSLAMRTQDGWRWFNTVFDLGLGPPHPKLMSVDNLERGGIFWWRDSDSHIAHLGGDSRVTELIKQTGRYGCVITDIALQSALAISLFLDHAGISQSGREEQTIAAAFTQYSSEPRFSKEEKAQWWYQWAQALDSKRAIFEEEAYELLQELATKQEAHICPPWSPHRAEWPSTKMSLATFQKYLARCRNVERLPVRDAEDSSVVRQLADDGVISSDARVVPATEPSPRHRQAKSLRAAAVKQEARDAEANELGYDLEPPIDSQGFPF